MLSRKKAVRKTKKESMTTVSNNRVKKPREGGKDSLKKKKSEKDI